MKLLVAGGRNLYLSKKGFELLDKLHKENEFTELVNGMATGVDDAAREWAERHGIPLRKFSARWKDLDEVPCKVKENKYGKYNSLAGLNRNKSMLEYTKGGMIVVFPGGNGTRNMLEISLRANEDVINLMDRKDLVVEL